MIARLKGLVDSRGEDWVVLDVGGVGYIAHCPARTLARLPSPGEAASLYIETMVREDAIALYGFSEGAERDWFRLLLAIQGVGARVALGVLSALSPDQLARAIAAQDRAALTRAPGVGPKLAARMLVELKDKAVPTGDMAAFTAAANAPAAERASGPAADAVSALVNLGYGRSEAFAAVARAARDLGAAAEVGALVRAALKEFAQAATG